MKRRDFIKGTILTGSAGMIFEACTPAGSEQVIPVLIPEEQFIPGVAEFLATTCQQCPGGCGLLARKIDGRIVKVEGNPAHPISRGATCARGQASPQALYHPDRIRQPLMREGERGEGRWREVSWDEALDRLSTELGGLRDAGNTESLAFLTGAQRGHRPLLVQRFLQAFGSSRHWIHEPLADATLRAAHASTTGHRTFFVHDIAQARYAVSLGAALLEGTRSPVRYGRELADLRRGRPGIRGKLVAIEPRLSLTASTADEWLPARPGSEAAIALALAHVIVRDELQASQFIADRTSGFEAFRDEVLPGFAPAAVAEAADISADAIERVAHELATNGPAVVMTGDAAATGDAGLATALAVAHLNALLGAYGRAGGIFFDSPPPFAPWPSLGGETSIEPASFSAWLAGPSNRLTDVQALLVSGTNPVFSAPAVLDCAGAIGAIPFVAAFATVLDETAMLADVVLPEPSPFERFDDDIPDPGAGIPMASLSGPLFSRALYEETRSMPDALIALATQLGGGMVEAFPWTSYEEALRAAWAGLQAAGTGSVTASTASGFWRQAVQAGGWWDDTVEPSATFATDDGRYRFEIEALRALTAAAAPTTAEYPLTLIVHGSVAFGDGRSAHLPFLQELADPLTGVRWGSAVAINPATAAEQNIESGDTVELASEYGTLTARAWLTPGLRPDVVAVAAGQGHTAFGRFATNRGANPYRLLAPAIRPEAGEAALQTAVRLRRVSVAGEA